MPDIINQHFHCVIMAGGIGSRFWPLSNTETPKQFIDILGIGATLIQQTYDRFKGYIPDENFWVVTSEQYKDKILEQLPEIPFSNILTEPIRRNTAACIAYATWRINLKDKDAVMAVTPADHVVFKKDVFEQTMRNALTYSYQNTVLLTIGLSPTFPATGYGYIQRGVWAGNVCTGDVDDVVYKVESFREKPDEHTAEEFIKQGNFFWNSGIFVWSVSSIQKAFRTYLPDIAGAFDKGADVYGTSGEKEFIRDIYKTIQSISVDYGIMEQSDNTGVICADMGWSDLGTWQSLYQLSDKDENGNHINAGKSLVTDSGNNIIRVCDKDKKVVISGLDGYIIVDTGDVIMICPAGDEKNITKLMEKALTEFDKPV